ncbi:MAG: hypothetical protein Q8Q59_09285 [Luteolibacter sp.]|nr:hypothetical protein [Luteolibacter sp.]
MARTEVRLAKRLQALDQEIAAYLNSRPHPKRKSLIKSSRRVADEKAEKRHRRRGIPMPCPVPEQIAKLAGEEEITLENIQRWLGDLGILHEPTKNGTGLKLTYPKLRKTGKKYRNARGRYPLRELVLRIKEARFDLDLVKNPEKYQDHPSAHAVATTEPVTPEPVTPEPVTPELVADDSRGTSKKLDPSTKKQEKTEAQKQKPKPKDKNDEMEIN